MESLPDLRAYEIAAAVIAEGSMSLAAARLNLTQSAVSQAVKRAEAQVGALLIHRDTRPLAPTEAGRVLVARMRDVSMQVARLTEEMRAAAARPELLDLRLAMIDSFAATVGPFLLRELMDGALALRLTALSGLATAHSEALLRHAIDAVVTSDTMDGVDDLDRIALFREPFVLVGPAGSGAALAGRSLADLLGRHRLIRFSARSHMGLQVERHLRRLGLNPAQTLSLDTSESLLAMVASGMGLTITTPLCLLQGALHRSALEVLPLPGPGFSRDITLITRRGEIATLAPRIAAIVRTQMHARIVPQIADQLPWLAGSVAAMVLAADGPTAP